MSRLDHRHPEGSPGDWYIDDRCMRCGASEAIAPDLIGFSTDGGQYVFHRQPGSPEEVRLAQLVAEVCPTRSVGTVSRLQWASHHPVEVAPSVWRCGSNSPSTAGGHAYLIQHPSGNVMVDAPRYTGRLRDAIEALGGLAFIALTHRDDVGDAERYARAFGAEVGIHEADADAAPFATQRWRGRDAIQLRADTMALPTPGHTEGHVVFLHRGAVLFTGDTLAWNPHRRDLSTDRLFCWFSWPEQLASLERLADHRFTTLFPSHGAVSPTLPAEEMRERLLALVARRRARDASTIDDA
jgi:glyoxylase-like metal-dependent hydrolase (beta-lactamase superfamily II)/ferredoxin